VNYKAGDKVRVRFSDHHPEYIGMETRIVSGPHEIEQMRTGELYIGYRTELPWPFAPRPEYLEPILPPPQLVSWDEACFDRSGKWKEPAHV